jgi:hypothetical protein
MDRIKCKLIMFFKKKEIIRTNDLIPTGIKSTIKNPEHGTINHYNQSWKHIHSQIKTSK